MTIKEPKILYYNDTVINSSKYIEDNSIDLFFCDPPYFISGSKIKNVDLIDGDRNDWDRQWDTVEEFYSWVDKWISLMYNQLKDTGSAYICASWEHSGKIQEILKINKFKIRNRITWLRDKGRGAKTNWKSMHEDLWFVTKTDNYTFNLENVMVKKEVVAPYKDEAGNPKDWYEDVSGKKIRYTHPGNLWVEFTVPFWSMKEVRSYAKTKRTPMNIYKKHNTQKPKNLVKKCIMASSNEDNWIADYFVGSGTTSIAAFELNRNSIVLDINKKCIGMLETRLEKELDKRIFLFQ